MASVSLKLLLAVFLGLSMLCDRASARFFMLGDLEEAQPESQAFVLNTTVFHDFTTLGHDAEMLAMTTTDVRGQINYSLGARVNGDVLVAHGAKNQPLPGTQNVAIQFTYPASGLGAQVTYVAIQVDQSSNLGRAYVKAGGLHQRMISIVVEAYQVNYINYSIQFYGVP